MQKDWLKLFKNMNNENSAHFLFSFFFFPILAKDWILQGKSEENLTQAVNFMTWSNCSLGNLLPSYLNSGSQAVCFTPLSFSHEFQCCHTFPSSTYTSVLSNSLPIDLFFSLTCLFFSPALRLSTTTFILELDFNHPLSVSPPFCNLSFVFRVLRGWSSSLELFFSRANGLSSLQSVMYFWTL